ncbi:MAG: LysM protein [Burkholderiaceae bacterium]|nr:LysM protein [Burkholderiaceae bacterium]
MFALQQSIRSAALRAGKMALATACLAGPAIAVAQPATVRYPVTEEQRQTAGQVAQLGVPLSALAANAPDTYTVKRGDTLWDISSIFLTSPWRWPELWGMNKAQIANPHLIYPGQTLRLVKSDGRARLELAGGEAAAAGDVVRLSPTVRDLGSDRDAIPSIPNRIIEPFLSRPAIVSPDELARYPRIVATQEQRVHVGVGDTVFGRGFTDEAIERFAIFRPARPLFDPDDVDRRRPIAWEAFYLGVAQKTRGGDIATLRILESTQEIGVGDRLVPITRVPVINYVPRRPEQPIDGRIVSIYSGLAETGTQSIVTLNRGARQGMQVGYVLALLDAGATIRDRTSDRRELITLPDERIGVMFVFRVFDEISYALVFRVTKPVRVGDRFTQPE